MPVAWSTVVLGPECECELGFISGITNIQEIIISCYFPWTNDSEKKQKKHRIWYAQYFISCFLFEGNAYSMGSYTSNILQIRLVLSVYIILISLHFGGAEMLRIYIQNPFVEKFRMFWSCIMILTFVLDMEIKCSWLESIHA